MRGRVDHVGHGRSAGDRVVVQDFERVVDDLHLVEQAARAQHPGLPVVLVGHSMGGLIAARHAQRYGDGLAAVVLSGPLVGEWGGAALLAVENAPPGRRGRYGMVPQLGAPIGLIVASALFALFGAVAVTGIRRVR